ncbi:arginine--tRNA ligase [Patescibacteria group bacterium]|nr:arginine--tRNA ligase [Patescibacteria group bacterium]
MSKKNLIIIQDVLLKAIKKAGFDVKIGDIHIDKTKMIEHGHFASNVAMFLAGKTGKRPREVAEKVIESLDQSIFEKVTVAGPGFINFWLEQKFYTTECQFLADDLNDYLYGSLGGPSKKTMVIDTSHPNVAKPMGVHHLLSTIIGDSIKKIYKRAGYEVINDNYLGDWGTQFGKLIYAIRTWGVMSAIEKNPIPELLNLYVKFHDEAEKDPGLDDFGRLEFKKLEEGDRENRKLWKFIVEKSMDEFNRIYKRLNVEFDVINGESFYEDKMPAILKYGRDEKIFVDGEKGAWIVMPKDPNDPPAVIKKADGATLYITRDLARIQYWEKTWSPDLMVNVVDVAQEFYFNQLFDVADRLKLTGAQNVHVKFGRMQFKDARMSTRKGNIILLEELLDEAEERAYKLAQEKGLNLSDDEVKELSRIMGIGAVKYNILSQSRTTNITFDWDRMLTFEGNSVPYLMYTVTRAKSVLHKSGFDMKDISRFDLEAATEAETKILIQLMMYPDTLNRAAEEFKPNHIANYLYQLSQEFNTFYNGNPILKAESEDLKKSRLLMTACVIRIMDDGFSLLGISVPDRM